MPLTVFNAGKSKWYEEIQRFTIRQNFNHKLKYYIDHIHLKSYTVGKQITLKQKIDSIK